MIDMKLDFSGLLDISGDLDALSKAESGRMLRNATRSAATLIKDEAVRRAPERAGKLAENIVVLTQRTRNGDISSGIDIRGRNPDTDNSSKKMKASDSRNAFHWQLVELGTSDIAATPFIRPAYETKQDEAVKAAFDTVNRAIDEALTK
ncbi:HK97-gp10 family putative phage morphogenesis protein [Pantoea sp. GD03673]|uniref:HK97-gp10 family putative phage morphogenesis protein n=1 Tax=Pantoea sp. GD03673 TaxID=2975364 RepID=UPI00244A534C|nr:HK97-gp10 family putative phage morphogenesis protein [Pantoea sp. GD03673]MDH2066885.1 HK97 gp10 family phage protein [Pantoea sp. GD03673]